MGDINNLQALSNRDLVTATYQAAEKERRATVQVIRYLAEVDARRLYAVEGFSSLYDFAVRGLRFTNGGAMRRIKPARAGRAAPELFEYLESGELNLATAGIAADLLSQGHPRATIQELRGKSQQEAEEIAARHCRVPEVTLVDRIRPVTVVARKAMVVAAVNPEKPGMNLQTIATEKVSDRFHVSFAAGGSFRKKLERAQALAFKGNRADVSLENVLEKALDLYLEKHCPKERHARRVTRLSRQSEAPTKVKAASRKIPARLRDEVLTRDGLQCTYHGPQGVRCTARADLEADHCVPGARGGETSLENLRTLCQQHNLLAAEEELGREFVQEKIRQARVRG